MASTLHQGILALFQDDPWLAFDILGIARPTDGRPIPRRAEVERDGKKPWTVRQGYPDLVMIHRYPKKKRKKKRRGAVITIEAQTVPDHDKRWMIPVYQTHLAEEHRLPTWSVVVSLSAEVSRALRAWRVGDPPIVDVLLLDVDTVSKSWLDQSARRPMAAVLAGILHGYAGDFEAARRGFHVTRKMSKRRGRRHGMTILAALPKHQRDQLLKEVPVEERSEWIEVERRSGTYHYGHEEGLEKGREEGRLTLLDLIFDLLTARGVRVDAGSQAQIRDCRDLALLRRWARRAADATSVAELFEPG